jgi:hypothetical protein
MITDKTHQAENVEGPGVDLAAAVRHNADNDLLPAIGTPGLGASAGAQVSDVLENAESVVGNECGDGRDDTHAFIVFTKRTSSSLYLSPTRKSYRFRYQKMRRTWS